VQALIAVRAVAAVVIGTLGIASAELAASWQLAPHALTSPAGLMAVAAAGLAGVIIAMLAQSAWLAGPLTASPLLRRAVALRRKSWGAVFQRQLNPDAAGHTRPRAPSAVPAAA
jgi:Family of unknown function (DUF6412)